MKKFLKIALGLVALFVVFVIAMGIYVVHGLPSISSLGSALHRTKSAAESLKSSGIAQLAPTVSAQNPETQIKSEEIIPPEDAKKSAAERAMVNDLMSTDKPLSDFCGSLKNSKSGIFNEKEFGQAFIESASDETKDPRIQAMKPMLRYVMRLPKVNELIKQAEAAVDRNDESFLKKAEFYSQAVTAFTEMKDHQADIESVMDRSYLLLQLSKIVAQKPELLTDARIQSYCSGVELAFNQSTPVDYETEKKDFLSFLDNINVKPKEIGFNVDYKSDVKLNLTGKSMNIEGGWLSDIVKEDVEAAGEPQKRIN